MTRYLLCWAACASVAAQGSDPDADAAKYLDGVYARYDRTADGKVGREEFPGSAEQFAEIDADRDGWLTRDEFAASPTAKRLAASYRAAKLEPRARTDFPDLAARRMRAALRHDRDRNGAVSRTEWNGTTLGFRSLDSDGNGVLDTRDVRAAEAETRPDLEPLPAFTRTLPPKEALLGKHDRNADGALDRTELGSAGIAAALARFDTNGDRGLDATELQRLVDFVAAEVRRRDAGTRGDVPRMPDVPFATWDADKDGRLANSEFEHRALFPLVDVDRDGFVTKTELVRYERGLTGDTFVARFDLDGDGRVTAAEFGCAPEVFRRADRNGDGVVHKSDAR